MTTSMKRVAAVVGASLLYAVFFPRVASLIADRVPFAHLIFAPFGSTLIATIAFGIVLGWLFLSWVSPGVIDHTARSVARMVGGAIGLAWVAYAAFWMLLYLRGGL